MRKGDQITVAHEGFAGGLAYGNVTNIAGGRITYSIPVGDRLAHDTVATADRGIKWARGHNGHEVNALRVQLALGSTS